MSYDFTTLIDRSHAGSEKWNLMRHIDPSVPEGIVPFSVADMELKNPPELVEGLKKYIDTHILGYSVPTQEYRRSVIGWMERRHGWKVDPEWIVNFDGVVPALFTAVGAFTKPGEGVIYMPPVYRPIYHAINSTGRRPEAVRLIEDESGYGIDFAALERVAARPDVVMLILCNPHNPVGRVWTKDELQRLGDICLANNVLVVSDEIHLDFVMPGHRHLVFSEVDPRFADRCLVCTAPSKTFNIAGLQVSNIMIPNSELRHRFIGENQKTGRYDVNQLGPVACQIVYEQCEAWLDELLRLVHHNGDVVREFFATHFPEVKMHDHQGTYCLWLDFRAWGLSNKELEHFMVQKARLFLNEGYGFGDGGDGFERINVACPTRILEEGLARLLLQRGK